MQKYRSSIHMQFDLPDPYLLDRYVLTTSHSKVLSGIIEGVVDNGSKHAHLLIGPYGTGKSLLSTILCQLLSRQFADQWSSRLREQAERIDIQLAEMLNKVNTDACTYIPVLINGKTGSLSAIINQAVDRALHLAGIQMATPNESAAIRQTVDRWQQSYPEAYRSFLHLLRNHDIDEQQWRDHIESCNEEWIQLFVTFYPSVTAGTAWTYDHNTYFIENLENISKRLAAQQIGLFIVYDEFGRFLQSIDSFESSQHMQDLQSLAEYADRVDNVHLLLVSHKHMRQYAVNSRESIRLEFEKIEGRFRHYTLENDTGTYLQLAQEAMREINRTCLEKATAIETIESISRFSLFSDLSSYQLEQGMLESLYPVHPVTVLLMPHLSNIYGQNERTLFSFLSDQERDSLHEHLQHQEGYYYADRLFRFFRIDSADVKEQSALELYHAVVAFTDVQYPMQKRIVELVTMWSETRLTQKQPITIPFLAFTLGVEEAEVSSELERLSEVKIVRFNSVREQWELFNGSSLDLEEVIAGKTASTALRTNETMEILERHLPVSFILPYDYNDRMDMLRFADIRFATIMDMKSSLEKDWPGDDRIWLVVYEDMDQIDDPDAVMHELPSPFLAVFPSFSLESVRASLIRYKIIDQLLHDTAWLALDVRFKNELQFLQEETSLNIREFVRRYFAFDKLQWRSGTEEVMIKDLHAIEQLVSDRMMRKYSHTPIIRNEAFNRNRISAIQRRALVDVIDRLIQVPQEPQFGITGYGPNYLIFATALKNNGYRIDADGNISCNEKLQDVRLGLLELLEWKPNGRLSELISLMQEAPYGLRSSVVPLLFVALLRDHWDQLHFYSHDMMISQLNGNSILEMIELADSFEYRYYNWSPEERQQLMEAGQRFELPAGACNSFIEAAGALQQWLRRLPKFAQITQQLSSESLWVRDRIRATEVDPYAHMKQLIVDPELLASSKNELESFVENNEHELELQILSLTGQQSLERIFEVLNHSKEVAIGRNSKLLTLTSLGNVESVINAMAEHLVGVARTDWSDSTQSLFLNQVKYEWELLMAGGEAAVSAVTDIDMNQPLSKKSQTLYANVKNMLKYAGRDVSNQEIKQLLAKLIQEI